MKHILGTIIAMAIGVAAFFVAREYLSSNQQFVVKTLLTMTVQIGIVVALVLVSRKNKQLRDLLKKHGIDEKSNV